MKVIGHADGDPNFLLIMTKQVEDIVYVKTVHLETKQVGEEMNIDRLLRFVPCVDYEMSADELHALLELHGITL